MLDLAQIDEAVRSEGGISRRLLLAYGAALAGIPTLGLRAAGEPKVQPKFQNSPFKLGVASGDPYSSSVVLWTRLAPHPDQPNGGMPKGNVDVECVIANDEKLQSVVERKTVTATADLGYSVHVLVEGLKPDRWYWYQFRCGDFPSPKGRTRTLPAENAKPDELKFAVASCQSFEDGLFTAYKHMAGDELDFVLHLGDYIYESGARDNHARRHIGKNPCRTLTDYRLRHCQYREDEHLQKMHARCPWVVTWDDHEVEDDYADDRPLHRKVDPAAFLKQRAAAYQAYYEMLPLHPRAIPKGPNAKLSRSVKFGQLAIFQVLDTRQHRTGQPNGGKAANVNLNPNGTLLGTEQFEWLKARLIEARPVWSVLAQQVMMGLVDRDGKKSFAMDQWAGYAAEREKLLQFLVGNHVANPVVLSGDIHSNWVNDLRVDDRRMKTPVVATEFVGTSISSKGDGKPVNPQTLATLQGVNPFVKFHNDERGYIRCTVTEKKWQSEFVDVRVVEQPGGAAKVGATYVIQVGKPGADKG